MGDLSDPDVRKNVTAEVPGTIQPRTYIAITFWGEEYRAHELISGLYSIAHFPKG